MGVFGYREIQRNTKKSIALKTMALDELRRVS
jgi:hypothetical protein